MPEPEATISSIQLNLNSYKVYDVDTNTELLRTAQANVYTVVGVTEDDGVTLRRLSIAELVMVVCLARAAEKEEAVIALMREMSDTTSLLNALTEIETKLLEGENLYRITGEWNYNGTTYTKAIDLLGACGVVTLVPNYQSLARLEEDLKTSSCFDLTGTYVWNGMERTAYEVLIQSNCLSGNYNDYVVTTAYAYAYRAYNKGAVALDAVDRSIYGSYGIPADVLNTDCKTVGYYLEKMFYDGKVKQSINSVVSSMTATTENITKDQLITGIESKMDSLNSFSQQKMIELQSETNKRDQAYDMITNILKSLNTVQVGIANNI